MALTTRRMSGAAKTTTGSMIVHDKSHDLIQWPTNPPVETKGKLVIAAATAHVKPDCVTPYI
jgi:hypothetical protein